MQTCVRDLMALEAQRKDKERKEGRSKQEVVRGFCLFEETPLVFEAQQEFAAAIQNAIQRYCVIYDEKKQLVARRRWIVFFQQGRQKLIQQRTRSCAISVRCTREAAACPTSPIAASPSAAPPPVPPLVSSCPCLLTPRQPVCQLPYCTAVLFKALYGKTENVLFLMFVFYVLFV